MRSLSSCLSSLKTAVTSLFVLLLLLVFSGAHAANIAAWDFTGSNNIATLAATVFDANLVSATGANNITRGAGAAASAGTNSFRTTGFSNNGISTANTDYFQITLTAATGYNTSLSTIDARFSGTASFCATPGVTTQFAYSLNGSTFTLIGSPVAYVGTPATMTQINVSGIAALQNVPAGTTITIRFYASGQTTTGGFGFNSPAAGSYGLAIGGNVSCTPTAVTATPSATTLCAGQTLTLTGTATNATGYSWSGPNSFTSTALSPAAITTSTASAGVYTLNATNACGTTSVTTTSIAVNPYPTIVMSGGATTICSGSTTTLGASGATTYVWSPTTGLSSSTGSSVTLTGTTSTIYTVTGTSAGCSSTGTRSIAVNAVPTITATPGTSSYCNGSSTTISASGASSYTWTPATGLSATTGSLVTCNATVTTTYTITGTNAAGCTGTTTQTITVNPLPVVVTTPGSAAICIGSSTTISASGAATYSWSPATDLSATTGSLVTCTAAATTTYTVTGISAAGCINTTTQTITVNPYPVIAASSGASTICSGTTTTMAASGATTYVWSPATGLSSSTASSPTLTGLTSATYTVTGTTAGCSATATVAVSVIASPTVTVTPATSAYCIGATTTITSSGADAYSWSPATGLNTTTGSAVSCNATATTIYTITGTNLNGCTSSNTSTITVIPLPTITTTPGAAAICIGNATTISAAGAATYSWSPATGLSATTGSLVTCNVTATTTYTVTGTSASGCTNTTTQTITVNPLPAIVATPGSSTICNGTSTTISASGANTYTWIPATGLSATTGALVTCTATTTTTYTVTGTNGNGCVSTATTSISVTNITVSAATPTYCSGSNTAITAVGATTYTWTPATSLSATTGATVTCSSTATRTYTVTGTIAGCVTKATQVITVNALPTLTQTAGSTAICIGAATTITAGGAVTYTWAPGATLNATTGTVVTATPTVTTAYTLTGTDANGCVNSRSRTITVNALPTIATTVGSGTLCIGASTTITATGGSTYTWAPATYLSATTGATVTSTPTVSLTYTVTGTNASGCVNTATRAITVNPLPTITATAGGPVYCIGGTTTIAASGGSTYTWSPATALSATTGITVTASPTVSTIYTITGTNANGCVNKTTQSITVNPLPVITATAGSSAICIGSSTTITGAGGTTYNWSPATGLSATTGATVTASPTVTTTYTVTGTNSNGCINTNTVTVTVNALPVISSSIGSTTICIGNATTVTASGAVTYVWSPATGLSSTTGVTVTASPSATTTYTITGTNANGCVNSATRLLTINPLPVINPSAASAAICNGSSTDMSVTGALTYVWLPATGLTSTTGSSVHCSTSATTTYTVTGTDINGCINSATQLITVNPLPVINPTTATPTICLGSTATISVSGASAYSWAPATGLNTTTGSSVSCNATTTTTYTITGTSSLGCVSTSAILLTVNSLPVPTFTTAPASLICTGQLVTYATQSGNSAYSWTIPGTAGVDYNIISGGISSTDNSVSLKWLTIGVKDVYVNYANAPGCSGLSAAHDTTSVNSAGTIAPITGNTSISVGTTASLADATPGGVWSSANSSAITIDSVGNIHALHVGSSMIHYTVTNYCGSISANVLVSSVARMWVGGAPGHESNWNTNNNWADHNVPDSTDDVVIAAGATYYPSIPAATSLYVRDLNIDTNVTITVNAGAKLKVVGNFINNGVINGDGAVAFNHDTAQKISGKGHIRNVEIDNAAGVSIDSASHLTITRSLTLTRGTFTTNDSLTLYSDTGYTARIAPIAAGASIVGKIRSKQYIQGNYRRFRFWSHPFTSALSLVQIQQYIDITGTGGAANGFTTTGTNAPSAFRYDPYTGNSALGYDPGWKPFTNITALAADTNMINRYQSIRLFVRGDKGEGLGYGSYMPSATTITMVGNVNQGTQVVHLSKGSLANQDINMVGNPYPAPVDLGTVIYNAQLAGCVAGSAYYVWNESLGAAGQYQAVPIGTSAPVSYYLQANAGFQVRAAHDHDSLVFNESHKGTDATTYLFKAPVDFTSLYVYDANYHLWDMLRIDFNSKATEAEDDRYDAIKLPGADFNFYSLSADNKKLTIDSRPFQPATAIPLGITSPYTQDFIIKAESTVLPQGASLYLHDMLLNTYTLLNNGGEYKFTISKDSSTQGNKRFELITDTPASVTNAGVVKVDIYPNPATDNIKISFSSDKKSNTNIAVFDVAGVSVYNNDLGAQQSGSVVVSLNNFAAGIYLVEVTAGDKKIVKRLIKE